MTRALSSNANTLMRNGEYGKALELYHKLALECPEISTFFKLNVALCERQRKKNWLLAPASSPEVFVTMTTISDRLEGLISVIESLHQQSMLPVRIDLNISEDPHLLDKGVQRSDKRLKRLEEFPLLHINWVDNTGPYRKIIPFLERHFSERNTSDKVFITVDDDTLYPEYFIKHLYEKYLEFDSIVAFRGRSISANEASIGAYSSWGLGTQNATIENLPTGKDGIIYCTKFFTKEFVDIDIALELAPTADDLWIKWHCALNGVKSIVLNPEAATSDYKSFPVVCYSDEYRDVSLYRAHNAQSSGGKNDISVENLERHYSAEYGYNLHSLCMGAGEE